MTKTKLPSAKDRWVRASPPPARAGSDGNDLVGQVKATKATDL